MKRPLSLRTRLVGWTLLAVAVVWLLTAFATWREARHEIEELLAHPPGTSATHLEHERAELVTELAGQLLRPLLFALPALGLLLVLAIGLALAPLRRLTHDIEARAPDRLDPLPVDALPPEVVPLVVRLNSLFADIARALENERRFTADAAHELRTPLAALKAQTQVAMAALDDAERQRALNQILAGCDRATHLVAQLLTLARLDAGTAPAMSEIALRPIAEEALATSAGEAIERNCSLVLHDGDAHIRGNVLLLEVLLRNLIDNALRHGAATQVEVSIGQTGQGAMLAVSDDGVGIPADQRDLVQQRFHGGAGTSGSGLGLSIVRRIAELHGGTVEIATPAAGRGVSLRVYLPDAARQTMH